MRIAILRPPCFSRLISARAGRVQRENVPRDLIQDWDEMMGVLTGSYNTDNTNLVMWRVVRYFRPPGGFSPIESHGWEFIEPCRRTSHRAAKTKPMASATAVERLTRHNTWHANTLAVNSRLTQLQPH